MTTLLDTLIDEAGACCSHCASGAGPCGQAEDELEGESLDDLDFAGDLELESPVPARVPVPKAGCPRPTAASKPRQGCFYRIREGDNLFATTAKAYDVPKGKERLALARVINDHPYNRRFWGPGTEMFPKGLISFRPRFVSSFERQKKARGKATSGNSFPVIFIPTKSAGCSPPGLPAGARPHFTVSGFGFARVTLPSEKRLALSLASTVCLIFLGLGRSLERKVEVFLVGHASSTEGRRARKRLGERRAKSIQRFIQRQLNGIFPGAGRSPKLRFITHSCGHRHPVAAGSEAGLNRRVEVFLFVEGKRCFFPREFPKCALQPD